METRKMYSYTINIILKTKSKIKVILYLNSEPIAQSFDYSRQNPMRVGWWPALSDDCGISTQALTR